MLFVLIVIGQLWLADSSLIRALVVGLATAVLFASVQYWSICREGSVTSKPNPGFQPASAPRANSGMIGRSLRWTVRTGQITGGHR